MKQDLKESPIDSGLRCPWCEHNLTSLMSSLCPECGKCFVLTKPGFLADLRHRSFRLTNNGNMTCCKCGHPDERFMPSQCAKCGNRFSLRQQIFGTNKTNAVE